MNHDLVLHSFKNYVFECHSYIPNIIDLESIFDHDRYQHSMKIYLFHRRTFSFRFTAHNSVRMFKQLNISGINVISINLSISFVIVGIYMLICEQERTFLTYKYRLNWIWMVNEKDGNTMYHSVIYSCVIWASNHVFGQCHLYTFDTHCVTIQLST